MLNEDTNGQWQSTTLDRKSIFRSKHNALISVVSFALPAVKKGSLIEYRYTSTCKHYGGLSDWRFQRDIPTLRSRYYLKILDNSEFRYYVQKKEELPITVEQNKNNGSLYLEMNNIAGLHDGPYMDSPDDFIQKVSFQLSAFNSGYGVKKYLNSWDEVSRELLTDPSFGVQLHKKLDGAKEIIQLAANAGNKEAQLFYLYNYVRKEMQWNGFYGKYSSEGGVKAAWNRKKGNSGDLNLILVNLLEEAGYDVKPLLIAERDHMKVNTSYPFIDQFNKVAAYVKTEEKTYILDVTDDSTPLGMTSEKLLNTTAFLVDRKKGKLIRIEETGEGYKHIYSVVATITKDNLSVGKASILSFNYGALERNKLAKTDPVNFGERFIKKAFTSIHIDSLKVDEVINRDTFMLKQNFSFTTLLETSGDYFLFNLLPFSGIGSNPFTAADRFSDVNFGARNVFYLNCLLTLEDGIEVESIPESLRLKLPEGEIEFRRRIVHEDNKLMINIQMSINHTYYSVDDYPMLVEFYKKLYSYLEEQIVLKKKK